MIKLDALGGKNQRRGSWLTFRSVLDLPFVRNWSLDADELLSIAGVQRMGDLSVTNAKVVNTLRTLAHISPEDFFNPDCPSDAADAFGTSLRRAAEDRDAIWLTSVTEADLDAITAIIGEGIVHRVGHATEDSTVPAGHIPIALSPTELISAWAKGTPERRAVLSAFLEGADTLMMKRATLRASRDVEANIVERNPIWRALRNPKVLAYLVVFLYSALRALPVVFVPGFEGNIWVLWTIDLVTAIPYTWGIIEMFAGKTVLRRVLGMIVTVVTFISPYIYFWMNGKHYPAWIDDVIAAMIIGTILIELVRWLRDRKVREGLVHVQGIHPRV